MARYNTRFGSGQTTERLVPITPIDSDYLLRQKENGIIFLADSEVTDIIDQYLDDPSNLGLTNHLLAIKILTENPKKRFQMSKFGLTGKIRARKIKRK